MKRDSVIIKKQLDPRLCNTYKITKALWKTQEEVFVLNEQTVSKACVRHE